MKVYAKTSGLILLKKDRQIYTKRNYFLIKNRAYFARRHVQISRLSKYMSKKEAWTCLPKYLITDPSPIEHLST